MKKLFTIDDFMIALISALGYGFGYMIASRWGWPEPVCLVACFALGIPLEELTARIVFTKTVQKTTTNRVLAYIVILFIFLIGNFVSLQWLGESMKEHVEEEFAFVVFLPILGFIVNMLIRWYRSRQVRKVYGDGGEGYVFDVSDEQIENINGQNRPILGEYDAECAVRTSTGIFVGERQKGSLQYLGIPYAKPPVGKLRWKAPEPLPASEAVYEAKNFGASAIQVEHKGSIAGNHRQSEDCLTLNVVTGDSRDGKRKPVLVLFHNGDFSYGGTADPLLYGDEFVKNYPDTVFVSFYHRLGIFGFIDFSEVPGGEAYPDAPNLGLLDQIAALRWIKENISAFGGDPDRVTVLGFGSGATSIGLLAACEQARGLFQRAYVFSGSLEDAYNTPEDSRALAKGLLEETKTETMEQLLELGAEPLKDAAQKLWRYMCAPTCDGSLIPADVPRAYREGKASGIEFVIGFPSSEMQVWRSSIGDKRYEVLMSAAMADLQRGVDAPTADALRGYLEAQAAATSEIEAKSKLAEQWNTIGIYRNALRLAEGGNEVHVMLWDEKPLIENLGSGTVDVAAALLGNREALQMYGNVLNDDLSQMLQALLKKFVNGDALQLYRNEIQGIGAFDWEAFPQVLTVSNGKITCDTIEEDKVTEVKALLDFMVK